MRKRIAVKVKQTVPPQIKSNAVTVQPKHKEKRETLFPWQNVSEKLFDRPWKELSVREKLFVVAIKGASICIVFIGAMIGLSLVLPPESPLKIFDNLPYLFAWVGGAR